MGEIPPLISAIQSGLRSAELRSLTPGRFFLDATPPYLTCKAGSTKNRQDARQYIQPTLAEELRAHLAANSDRRRVFQMPDNSNVSRMLRDDLAAAREAWLEKARKDKKEHKRRKQSDFLLRVNHEGEILDFHALRHTCGTWMAMANVHCKTVRRRRSC